MSNKTDLYMTPLDLEVLQIPPEERRQIMLDFDELERTGKNGDTVLRHHAGRIYQKLQHRASGFDAAYMMFVAHSAHKINSIEALREAEDLAYSDRKIMALQLVKELAKLAPSSWDESYDDRNERLRQTADAMDDLIRRARTLLGMEPEGDITPAP